MKPLHFKHGTWHIRFTDTETSCMEPTSDGECDGIDKRGKKYIYVRKGLSPKDDMETILHEIIHAWDPQKSEESVQELGRLQRRALRQRGYRRTW